MTMSLLPQFPLISVLLTIICIADFGQAYSHCLDQQRTLLLQLKSELIVGSIDRYAEQKLVQWNQTQNCCSWKGVECDDAGHVTGLQLDWEGITGGIENSSSLFNLGYLKKLNLAFNDINHTQIPRGIGNLTYLTHLNLSYAAFGGQIPIELSLLTRLVSLDISGNYFEPLNEKLNLTMLLQNLTGLRELYLDSIDISVQGREWSQVVSSSLPHLKILSLSYCSLSGPPHPSLLRLRSLSILWLSGYTKLTTFPTFFANFSSLTTLSLRDTSLQGSVPWMIFQSSTLQHLDLSYNELLNGTITRFPQSRAFRSIVLKSTGLSGSLPDSFNNLSMLSHLDLSSSKFSGPIPPTLANLTQLVYLDLSNNSFTGSIPPFYVPKNLTHIGLSHNNFSGSLSFVHFEGLSKLTYINLGYNSLGGSIPLSLFDHPSLETLLLNTNQFNGSFQLKKIPMLGDLRELDLSRNNLSVDAINTNSSMLPNLLALYLASCSIDSFPEFLKTSLVEDLDLSDNRIAGEIPSWIWEINGGVKFLNLSCNLLVGLQKPYRIPYSLGVLDLHSNLLQGELHIPIPPNIGDGLPILFSLYLGNNNLSGSIPSSLCNADYLEVVDLSSNNLSGSIPPCLLENKELLAVLNLGSNNISGDIPDKFPVNCNLEALDLSNNNIGGNIPKSLANCKGLVAMNVGNNNINGSFPCLLPPSLRLLVLRSNRFHGEVTCQISWPNLQIIDLSSNHFTGSLHPVNFSSWRGMMPGSYRQLLRSSLGSFVGERNRYYQDEVTLILKGLELKLVKIWTEYTSIDFSGNNFRGEIPDSIAHLGSLYALNLSHNALTGTIPKSFGELKQLGSLDLSANQLAGVIPKELAGLNFLAALNLSYNKLVGAIPLGPQIQLFSADSFQGNTGLCGFPLNISCNRTDENGSTPSEHRKAEIKWDYVSAALGYVVGLASVVWLLLCCRSLRRRYFGKVDEALEKIFDGRRSRNRRHGGRRVPRNQGRT